MGFWKQLFGTDKNGHFSHVPPMPKPPPPERPKQEGHKGEQIIPAKNISEPVLSIIQTLKDDEWSFVENHGICYLRVRFTHEWFGHKLETSFDRYPTTISNKPECQSEWMTQDEKEAVGDVCWQIYQGRVKWEKEQSLPKQRESFMNLVKEPNETN